MLRLIMARNLRVLSTVRPGILAWLCFLFYFAALSGCGKKEGPAVPPAAPAIVTAPQTSTETATETRTSTSTETSTETADTTDTVEPAPDLPPLPPLAPQPSIPLPERKPAPPPVIQQPSGYRLPEFQPAWGMKRDVYERAVQTYAAWKRDIKNPRFVTIVDFSKPSNQKRLFVFDLATEKMNAFYTSHGAGSDPRHSRLASAFSNRPDSNMSSLGAYITQETYFGEHGYSLRLRGLEPTNSLARERLIVMHGASYVSEAKKFAGRSFGCFALDYSVSTQVINRLKGGSLILAWR